MTTSFSDLTGREEQILKVLIDYYISTAEPVASQALAGKYDLGLSPATIRNTLKNLEELGLVTQPHTSAGRVPTVQGYRMYVEYLLRPEKLSVADRQRIRKNIGREYSGIDQILEQTSRVLGNVSNQLGVTVSPRFDSGIITRLELIPVADRRVLVVLAMRLGLARTVLLEVETDLHDVALADTATVLNERLCGLTVGEMRKTVKERLADSSKGDPRLIKMFVDSADKLLMFSDRADVHLGGTRNILAQPEFKDPARMRELFELIEERQTVAEMVSRAGISEGITVTLGVEGCTKKDGKKGAEELSLLSSTYSAGKFKGILGIIGPTRMPYSKLVAVVEYTAERLSEILSE
jgi:heat-inducible transcriptional repressor